jgi:hypothetical protein
LLKGGTSLPPIGSSHRRHQEYRLGALPRSHRRGATRGVDEVDSTTEAGVVRFAPPSSTSWGGGSTRGEADPHLLQRGGEREISMVVARWN